MEKLKFQTRVTIGFSILIFFSFIFVSLAILQIRSISSDTELIYEHPLVVSNSVRDINVNINAIHRSMKDLVLSENPEQLRHSIQLVNHYDSLIWVAFEVVYDRFLGNKSIVNDAYNTCRDWTIIRNEVIELTKAGNYLEAAKITKGKGAVHVKLVFEKTKVLTDFAQNKANELYQNTIKTRQDSTAMLFAISFVLLLLSILISAIISRSISKPIHNFITEIYGILEKESFRKSKFVKISEQEILAHTVLELKESYEKLENFKLELEQKVEERTRELEKSEAELKESNKTKDKFLSILAHDLKNPFHSLLIFNDLLIKNHAEYPPEEVLEIAQVMYKTSNQAHALLENLLEWSRLQTGRLNPIPAMVTPSDLVIEVKLLCDPVANAKNINLQTDIHYHDNIVADREMIKSVLRNLVNNAIKFSHPSGTVKIEIKNNEKDVIFIISDSGVGIEPEHIDKLFRIDCNLSSPGTANEEGTGLGLILCKEFVEKHGGAIWVESEFGKGSQFNFTIPLNPGLNQGNTN